MEMNDNEIYNHIMQNGMDGDLMGKPTRYLMLGNRKLHAYHVICEYIAGQYSNGEYIIDPQEQPALYLEKEPEEQKGEK